MKINKFFMGLGAIAALSLAACSNEDPGNPNPEETNGDGTTAYMSVVISPAGNSRGTSGETADDFEQSTTEHAVDNANFYFYTEDGIYVTTAQVWDGGSDKTSTTMPDKNIEFEGKVVLVLKDLTEAAAPAYVVTVLNAPGGFTPGKTLAEMEAKLALAANNAEGYAYKKTVGEVTTTYFMMSTSSYIHETGASAYEYLTTKVKTTDFLKYKYGEGPNEDDLETLNPVTIYVERLAAKVSLSCTATPAETIEGKKYYKIIATGGNTINPEDPNALNGYAIADIELYVAIEGWGLTNLNQNSYIMKNLTDQTVTSWHNGTGGSSTQLGTAAKLFRNYWAKAANIYGSTDPEAATPANAILSRYSWNELLASNLGIDDFDYCFENTNTKDALLQTTGEGESAVTVNNLGKLATSVMVCARIYQKNGDIMEAASLISHNGILFTEANFKNYILNALQTTNKYYIKTTVDENDVYTQITAVDVEIVAGEATNKGEVTVALTSTAAGNTWYKPSGSGYETATAEEINTALDNTVKNKALSSTASHAYMYKGGNMYYNIPIEHYRNSTGFSTKAFEEGDYGVVRNHIYKLTITSLTKLGKAVYDPDQEIIPDTPTDEDRYALGVKVNILSWKIVTQSVPL